jgi:hypothetical protein
MTNESTASWSGPDRHLSPFTRWFLVLLTLALLLAADYTTCVCLPPPLVPLGQVHIYGHVPSPQTDLSSTDEQTETPNKVITGLGLSGRRG